MTKYRFYSPSSLNAPQGKSQFPPEFPPRRKRTAFEILLDALSIFNKNSRYLPPPSPSRLGWQDPKISTNAALEEVEKQDTKQPVLSHR